MDSAANKASTTPKHSTPIQLYRNHELKITRHRSKRKKYSCRYSINHTTQTNITLKAAKQYIDDLYNSFSAFHVSLQQALSVSIASILLWLNIALRELGIEPIPINCLFGVLNIDDHYNLIINRLNNSGLSYKAFHDHITSNQGSITKFYSKSVR